MKKFLYTCSIALFLCLPLLGQTTTEDNEFWGSADSYLLRQTARTLDLVNQALQDYPPTVGNSVPRRLALSNLDAIRQERAIDVFCPDSHPKSHCRLAVAFNVRYGHL